MTGCSSLHYCYNVSYQCWFSSEEAKIYYNNFNSLNAVVCSHLILAYTVWLAIINAAELERNGLVFFYLYWGMLCWDWKEHRQKLAKRISYQIWYKRCLKGKFGRGVQICEGGVHIRCDTGTTYRVIWSTTSYPGMFSLVCSKHPNTLRNIGNAVKVLVNSHSTRENVRQ